MAFSPLPLTSPPPSPVSLLPTSRRSQAFSSPLNPLNSRQSGIINDFTKDGTNSTDSSTSSTQSNGLRPNLLRNSTNSIITRNGLDAGSYAVLTGQVGGSFGPFPKTSSFSAGPTSYNHRDSMASSDVAINLLQDSFTHQPPSLPYSSSMSESDSSILEAGLQRFSRRSSSGMRIPNNQKAEIDSSLLWDKKNAEADDYLHDPNPELDSVLDNQWGSFSSRGLLNVILLSVVIGSLVGVFMGWPVWTLVISFLFQDKFLEDHSI